jgi:hypothetical protein
MEFDNHWENQNSSAVSQVTTCNHCSAFTFTPFVSEGRANEVWERATKGALCLLTIKCLNSSATPTIICSSTTRILYLSPSTASLAAPQSVEIEAVQIQTILYFFAGCIGYQLRLTLFLVHRLLSPWWWRSYVLPKRRFLQESHSVTFQKTPFFTANVVSSSSILVALMMEAISSSERRFLQQPHGITSQKTALFIVTAVKTSNLTQQKIY